MALLTLADGRVLEYAMHGPEDGAVVVFHHGTPGAAVPCDVLVDGAGALGLRTLLYSRPGYGDSTAAPGRRVADCVGDVGELLDHLGIDAVLTAGWSGGGPHALATAALLDGRCASVAVLAGVAPFDAHGLAWTDGMGKDNLDEFAAAVAGASELDAFLAPAALGLRDVDVDALVGEMATLLPEVDVVAAREALGGYLVASFGRALVSGTAGWRDDDLAFVAPWGFEPADIDVPVALWFGAADLMVPESHGRWMAGRVRDPEVHAFAREGHLSIVRRAEAIFTSLIASLQ